MFELRKVSKRYGVHAVLTDVDFKAEQGEFVTVTGPSGSGKSTLINLIIGAEKPENGSIEVDGKKIEKMSVEELQLYRRGIGVVFQDYKLLKKKTVWENIAFALEVCGISEKEVGLRVKSAIAMVGLTGKETNFPNELSGGEQQRVAVARALVHTPKILLADEPTGNLDEENKLSIAKLFREINTNLGTTVLLTTHDNSLLEVIGGRVVEIKKEKIWERTSEGIEMTATFVEEEIVF